jgi:ribonuclease HI
MPTDRKPVTIYTDGACLGNPGPGGYAAVLLYGNHRKELSGGYRRTTNNRMEIMAAIVGLKALRCRCVVQLYTDSKYLQESISLGWAKRWQVKGWKKKQRTRVNWDLWELLLAACAQHDVTFLWVRGHAGDTENERCDVLSVQAAQSRNLPPDLRFEEPLPAPGHSATPQLLDPTGEEKLAPAGQ